MTDEAMSPLRRRTIEDMTVCKLAPKTQIVDVQGIKNFAAFLGRSPDMASFEDVRRYQLHLAPSGVGVPTITRTRGCFLFSGSRSGATISSSTRISFTSRASCRWCSVRMKWRGCAMRPQVQGSAERGLRPRPTRQRGHLVAISCEAKKTPWRPSVRAVGWRRARR